MVTDYKKIGKTESGKLYHIRDFVNHDGHFSKCGVYMPKELLEEGLSSFKLWEEGKMCEKCMYSTYFKQSRD